MPIDTSIYQNVRPIETPDLMGMGVKAMTLSQLAMQNKKLQKDADEDEAIKGILSQNTGLDGRLNAQGLSSLAKINPTKALQYEDAYRKRDNDILEGKTKAIEHQAKALDFQINQLGTVANLAMSARDQATYDAAIENAAKIGLDTSIMPKQFDPELVKRYAFNSTKQAERLAVEKQRIDALLAQQNAARDAQKQTLATTGDLRKERSGLPTTKATQDVSVAFNRIRLSAQDPSAAGDMALLYGFNKLLDPGSVVREAEFANAAAAGGVNDRIAGLVLKVSRGERLTPEQRTDFLGQAEKLYSAQLSQQKKIDDHYRKLAKNNGVAPEDVLVNFEADAPGGQTLAGPNEGGLINSAHASDKPSDAANRPRVERPKSDVRIIDGVKYIKVKGGWEAQE
jgi:hypothetical protein